MAGYLSSRKLTNLKGRINYITDPKRQENVIDTYNTTTPEFWAELAKENRQRHKEAHAGGKCCEARELIIGLPQNSNISAQELCGQFKSRYGVECTCAIHQNHKNGITNRHCHLIFSERQKLREPEVVGEKRATRNYYYDEKGKQCKKADATKIVHKGDITRPGITHQFSQKDEFLKSQAFVQDAKFYMLNRVLGIDWNYEADIRNRRAGLSERHIGKGNPNAQQIQEQNEIKGLIKDIAVTGDTIMQAEPGTTLQEIKGITQTNNFAEVNERQKEQIYDIADQTQQLLKQAIKKNVKTHNYYQEDMNLLQESNEIYEPTQARIINAYEPQSHTRNKPKLIQWLQSKMNNIVAHIQQLLRLQDNMRIPCKDQLEVEKDHNNGKLYVTTEEEREHNHNNYFNYKNKDDDELER